MIVPTRKMMKRLKEWSSWTLLGSEAASAIVPGKGNAKYRATVDRLGGYEVRRIDGAFDFVIDKSPDKSPSGLALAQHRKDVDLVKQVYSNASAVVFLSYTSDIDYFAL